jgi:hypothetical protein
VGADPRLAKLGVRQLEALTALALLDDYERTMVLAAVDSMEPSGEPGEGTRW